MQQFTWVRDTSLPAMFEYVAHAGDEERPTIWARITDKGWYCQFKNTAYAVSGTGTTRDKAANELMANWHRAMAGSR